LFLQTALAFCLTGLVCLCGDASAQSIYTCVDARGRRITADRPIPECLDRAQNELTDSGTVKRQLGPSLTAHEQAAHEAREKRAADLRAREAEEKRRDRALLLRYPSLAVHQQERVAALAQIEEVMKAGRARTRELAEQRKGIQNELEFYIKDPRKAPEPLKRMLQDNNSGLAAQSKFMGEREQEKNRINQRFDEELAKLQELWMPAASAAQPAAGYQNTNKKGY
jgi:hypothetical protein